MESCAIWLLDTRLDGFEPVVDEVFVECPHSSRHFPLARFLAVADTCAVSVDSLGTSLRDWQLASTFYTSQGLIRCHGQSRRMSAIVRDDDVRSGEPRIAGSRITVLDVKQRVIDRDDDPHVVAGEYDVPVADVFTALAYYYDNRDEFERIERTAADERHEGERRTTRLLEDLDRTDESVERAD